jgi:hypothetical protein
MTLGQMAERNPCAYASPLAAGPDPNGLQRGSTGARIVLKEETLLASRMTGTTLVAIRIRCFLH